MADEHPSLLAQFSWVDGADVLLFNESSDLDTWRNFTFGGVTIDEIKGSKDTNHVHYGGGNVGGGGGAGDGGGHGGGGNFGLPLYHNSRRGLFTLFSRLDPNQHLKDQMQLQEAHTVISSTNRQIFAEYVETSDDELAEYVQLLELKLMLETLQGPVPSAQPTVVHPTFDLEHRSAYGQPLQIRGGGFSEGECKLSMVKLPVHCFSFN